MWEQNLWVGPLEKFPNNGLPQDKYLGENHNSDDKIHMSKIDILRTKLWVRALSSQTTYF